MKFEMGSAKMIITSTAMMTAEIMMGRTSTRPTAVMTESSEKTTSITMMVRTACTRPIFLGATAPWYPTSARSSLRPTLSRISVMPL